MSVALIDLILATKLQIQPQVINADGGEIKLKLNRKFKGGGGRGPKIISKEKLEKPV